MPLASIDDQLTFNAKIVRAGNEAVGAWVRMIALANAQLTDGKIEGPVALTIAPKKILDRMVEVRLLERDNADFLIHDFHDFSPRAADVRERRAAEAKRKADYRAGQKRGGDGRMQSGRADGRPSGVQAGVPVGVPLGQARVSHRSSSSSSSSSDQEKRESTLPPGHGTGQRTGPKAVAVASGIRPADPDGLDPRQSEILDVLEGCEYGLPREDLAGAAWMIDHDATKKPELDVDRCDPETFLDRVRAARDIAVGKFTGHRALLETVHLARLKLGDLAKERKTQPLEAIPKVARSY